MHGCGVEILVFTTRYLKQWLNLSLGVDQFFKTKATLKNILFKLLSIATQRSRNCVQGEMEHTLSCPFLYLLLPSQVRDS